MADEPISVPVRQLLGRIEVRLRSLQPDNPRHREVLQRMAFLLEAQAKINVGERSGPRNKPLIDTGHLRAHLFGVVRRRGKTQSVIQIVSYATPYARLYEEGFAGNITVKAHEMRLDHFWHQQIEPIMVHVREHNRYIEVEPRPYVRPAIEKLRPRIIDELRKAFQEGG